MISYHSLLHIVVFNIAIGSSPDEYLDWIEMGLHKKVWNLNLVFARITAQSLGFQKAIYNRKRPWIEEKTKKS